MWASKKSAPLIRCVSRSYEVTQGLEGDQIALWASHGMYYNADEDRWKFQRARVWTTVEDLFTSSFTAPYLVPMLENAGAVVMQPRAYVRPGYQTIYIRWEEPSCMHPVIKTDLQQGEYSASYEVNTSQGVGLWHYLCTLPKGEYTLTGAESKSIDESTIGPSGYPRYMEAARYWVPEVGIPDEKWMKDSTYSDYLNDIVCRGGGLNYLLDQGIDIDMSLALHTDAGTAMTDSVIGTMAIYTHKKDAALADTILSEVVNDLQQLYYSQWPRRELRRANYGETRTPNVPAMILEVLSHQNYADMRYALDPQFRHDVSRAIYKGIGRYLAKKNGKTFIPQPLAPQALHTFMDGDSVWVTWQPKADDLEPNATPTFYIVYTRRDNGTWDNGTKVAVPRYALPLESEVQYDFCVAAGNAGGISLRSPIVSAYRSNANDIPMLIVDAFDEVRGPKMMAFDSLTGGIVPGSRPIPDGLEMAYIGEQINYKRWDPWHSDDDCGFGMCSMEHMGEFLVGNTHDYSAQHGCVLRSVHRSYVSCTSDAITLNDSNYYQTDIILGKSNQNKVKRIYEWADTLHWATGVRRVLISGAYIGFPQQACASGKIKMNDTVYTFHQELNTTHLSAEDVSAVSKNAPTDEIVARYSDTGLPAIIRNENYTIVGFPLETLDNFETIYTQLIR